MVHGSLQRPRLSQNTIQPCPVESSKNVFFVYFGSLITNLSVFQVAGFFKGMSFPLASITFYNSVVFGFFSNAQRLISKYRYGDGRHPCGMLDLTVASMLTGLMSVGLGAPVDLVKIRLQMQTQTILAGKSGFVCFLMRPVRVIG